MWLPGEAPCLKFGGASGGLLPALGCGVRLANWKDTRALREPPGTPPRAPSTLSERAPLLPARPRPARSLLGPLGPSRPLKKIQMLDH